MEDLLQTDPEQLVKEHCHLLCLDLVALASGPTKDELEWIAEVDSVFEATGARGRRLPLA
jgi:hypothetical protein